MRTLVKQSFLALYCHGLLSVKATQRMIDLFGVRNS